MVNHNTMPAINAAPKMPPRTPPAMAPVSVLPLKELEAEGEDVFWGVRPLVEVGTLSEALPVTSGESATDPRINKSWDSFAKLRTANKLCCGYTPGIIGLKGTMREDRLRKGRNEHTVGSRYTQRGIRVPAGMGSGKLRDGVEYRSWQRRCTIYVPAVATVVQLVFHME
jgi:hypothetical protein